MTGEFGNQFEKIRASIYFKITDFKRIQLNFNKKIIVLTVLITKISKNTLPSYFHHIICQVECC